MANAIYLATLPSRFAGNNQITGGYIVAASEDDAIAFLKGQMPDIPDDVWDDVTITAQVADNEIVTDGTDLTAWVRINGVYFYSDCSNDSPDLEDAYALLEDAIEEVHGAYVSYVAGSGGSAGVLTIASGANLGKATITAGVGYRRGLPSSGGRMIALPGLAPTVNAIQGSAAAARTVTFIAPNSADTNPSGFVFREVDLVIPKYNDSPVDGGVYGQVDSIGHDRA